MCSNSLNSEAFSHYVNFLRALVISGWFHESKISIEMVSRIFFSLSSVVNIQTFSGSVMYLLVMLLTFSIPSMSIAASRMWYLTTNTKNHHMHWNCPMAFSQHWFCQCNFLAGVKIHDHHLIVWNTGTERWAVITWPSC